MRKKQTNSTITSGPVTVRTTPASDLTPRAVPVSRQISRSARVEITGSKKETHRASRQ